MTTQITKVGRKGDNVIINFEDNRGGEVIKSQLVSDAKPTPEFDKAFADLGKYMCGVTGMADDWARDHTMLWLSIGVEKDDTETVERINAVTTPSIKLAKFAAPMTVNTPVMREKVSGVPGGGSFMPPKMLDLVKAVIEHAEEYLDGTRAQHELLPKAPRGSKKGSVPKKEEDDGEE